MARMAEIQFSFASGERPIIKTLQIDRGNGAGLGHLQFVNASGGEDVAP